MAEASEKKVKINLPRASGGAPQDVFCSVNGVNYIIPRGQTVEVPDYVAEEVNRAQKAEDFMFREKTRMKNTTT